MRNKKVQNRAGRNEPHKACLCIAFLIATSGLMNCGSISLHDGGGGSTDSAGLSIVAAGGTPQTHVIDGSFEMPLAAVVMSAGTPANEQMVTFTAPLTGASGTFADSHTNVTTALTNSSGLATSATFTANGMPGAYAVIGSVTTAPSPADFTLTNTPLSNATYIFYLSGQESALRNFYAMAGAIRIDSNGKVLAGVQDYNNAEGVTSPQPAGDAITGGSLSINSATGQGLLILNTNNPKLGSGGVETLAVQFVNRNHALIMQFDGIATSSGGMDLQSAPMALTGGYAFTIAGVDPLYLPVVLAGVFSVSEGTTLRNGVLDTNDDGMVIRNTSFNGSFSSADSFGRGSIFSTLNYNGAPLSLNYYVVGSQVFRIIDVDVFDSGLGSAYSQGSTLNSFNNASLANSVFVLSGTPFLINYAAAGMFFPDHTSAPTAGFSGIADAKELSYARLSSASPITGTYAIASDGYGNLTITPANLNDISELGLYMTDPNLNLTDPNNKISGLGGALVADMDMLLPGGTGVIVPQSDFAIESFAGKYAFAAQDIENFCCELDWVGQASVMGGTFSGSGFLGDPLAFLGGSALNSDVAFPASPSPIPQTQVATRWHRETRCQTRWPS